MQDVSATINAVVKELFGQDIPAELTRPDEQFGDFSTNVAMRLAGKLKKQPREVAEQIVDATKQKLGATVKDITIAGPGFINITLSDQALVKQLTMAANSRPAGYKNKVVVAEYSDPNPFKVLHAGHLYTTLVGDALSNLFEASGATVHRINYGGDVGLHVGKAMWGIIKNLGGERPEKLSDIAKNERAAWMSQRYVEGNTAYEDDPVAKAEIVEVNKRVYQVHANADHDSPFAKIYWACRQWSYDAFDDLYKNLQVHAFERYLPESEIAPKGIDIVNEGLAKGIFEKSDGAIVFKGEDHGLHTRVFITGEGLPTYEAKDLGLAATKWRDYKFDLSFIITGNDIIEYMKVVVKALEHFYPETAKRGRHLTHGMVKLPGGKKMSSRKGNILQASDILSAAVEASQANGRDNHDTVLAAVKYAFLKYRVGGEIIYDPQESVSLEGNSGPYLQYANARACSILAKASDTRGTLSDLDAAERSLARKITEYPEVLARATNELMPHHICTYLYELTQAFNRFYEKNRVVADPREAIRVQLLRHYQQVLKDALGLLGIAAPEKV